MNNTNIPLSYFAKKEDQAILRSWTVKHYKTSKRKRHEKKSMS